MHHIAIGTPMHANLCSGLYMGAVRDLDHALMRDGGKLDLLKLGNESHIQRGRNSLVWNFLEHSKAEWLLWQDGDIATRVPDIARMVAAGKDILAAPCPLKAINWERVARACAAGVPPSELHKYTAFFNIVNKPGTQRVRADEPFQIVRGGTGLMLVHRSVYEKLIASGTVESYANRNHGSAMPLGARVYDFHPSPVVEDDLLTEDFGFCKLWTDIGGAVWAAPWPHVIHAGGYRYAGCYQESMLAQVAAQEAA